MFVMQSDNYPTPPNAGIPVKMRIQYPSSFSCTNKA